MPLVETSKFALFSSRISSGCSRPSPVKDIGQDLYQHFSAFKIYEIASCAKSRIFLFRPPERKVENRYLLER